MAMVARTYKNAVWEHQKYFGGMENLLDGARLFL